MGPDFLILAPSTATAEAALADVSARLLAETTWRAVARCGRAQVWTPAGRPTAVLAAGATCIVLGRRLCGHGASGSAGVRAAARERSGARVIQHLLREVWGDYVALVDDPTAGLHLLRDPSGAIECLTWRTREGVDVATADLVRVPRWLHPPRQSLNWDRIATFLNAPSAGASSSLFDGVDALPPGGAAPLGDGSKAVLAWRPAGFAQAPITDLRAAEAELVRRVDACTAGLVASEDRLVFELSGGLDSSILATSLAQTGNAHRIATWYNGQGSRSDADEARYAQAVTDQLGVSLTPVHKRVQPVRAADFEELAQTFRPGAGGGDPGRDRDMVSLIQAANATGVVSGQGGDAAFYQMPSSWLVTDVLRKRGLGAIFSTEVAAMARRKRVSAWRVLQDASDGLRLRALPPRSNPLLTAAAAAHATEARHPWERDGAALPLSKQLQVRGVAQAHSTRADCRRARAAPLICPLMAQPVVELCLAIPAVDLALGVQDRPLARRAFAARLPPAVRERRSKGNLTAHFAQLVAASVDELRPFLLDGVLVQGGVLDRRAVERGLDPAQLIHAPRPSELLMAAAAEAWVRYWQTQVGDSPMAGRRRL